MIENLKNIVWFYKDTKDLNQIVADYYNSYGIMDILNCTIEEICKEFKKKIGEYIEIENFDTNYGISFSRYFNPKMISDVKIGDNNKCEIFCKYSPKYYKSYNGYDTPLTYEEFMKKFSHLLPFIRSSI